MIDTHCHLLHGLDDGPTTLEESVALARELVEAGVRTVVCTPHLSRRYPTDFDLAKQRLMEIETALQAEELELEVMLAAEISPALAVRTDNAELGRHAIGGRFVLIELEVDTAAGFALTIVKQLAGNGLIPVLAHPERCRAVRRDTTPLLAAQEAGAIVQVVANSLGGAWGGTIARAAWGLLTLGRADVVASDAHHPGREGSLAGVLDDLYERLEDEEVERLTVETPRALVAGLTPQRRD
jgi:protein-tyrosine phosphatase